ncbi:hypothetical protein SRS16CHR_03428 [Variovorax sp. SRS16]|uniref:hypothetical protein n=1 Tax=Variovorax sp. SRS16 TaxID=282217 RepID=UPI0013187D42|nr:hypothetical protein [Variovorax sp. SRS16]VTU24316.1 hypothetical protein SRS16CHR_03428 [Variovorax sp. SRS16]
MDTKKLLAVVEVAQSKRFACQAPGCGRTVFRRLHVVSQDGALCVVGVGCYQKIFHGNVRDWPLYGSPNGRPLTEREYLLLVKDPARLIARFEAERAAGERTAVAPRSRRPVQPRAQIPRPPSEARRRFGAQAEREVEAKYGLRSALKGWRSLVDLRIRELADRAAAEGR